MRPGRRRIREGENVKRFARRRMYLVLVFVLLGVAVALAAVGGSARGQHAALQGYKTPAIGAHPKYAFIGDAQPGLTVFECQTDTVGSATDGNACYGPGQIRTAYDINPLLNQGLDGSGRTIVIVDAYGSPTINQDLQLFDTAFGLPAPNFSIVTMPGTPPFDPTDPTQVNWSAETSLDVQWSHAIAPGAKIVLVVAKSSSDADILAATKYAFDNKLGDILSQSYGEAEQCMDPSLLGQQHQLFDSMTAQRWTLFASAGDDGSNQPTCDGNSLFQAASTPASDPDVTSVGGTQLHASPVVLSPPPVTILDPGGQYQSESTWNEIPAFGAGGGGFSVVYKRPDFQAPIVKNSMMRALPDVAYNAAVDGGVIGFWGVPFGVGAAFRFGGTSAGSPQWSGLIAITDQLAGGRVGNINKTLYFLGKKNQGMYFHDIADGSNNIAFTATPGFDEATGWGSPIAGALVPAIAKPGNG
jgi:subtilase family serine protease